MADPHGAEIAKLEALFSENPNGRVFTHLAEAYRRAGELERARVLLESGLARHGDYASAHVVHGRVLLDLGRAEEAEAAFRRVLGLDPENLVALRALGDLARRAGRTGEALGYYEQLQMRDPSSAELDAIIRDLTEARRPAADAEPEEGAAAPEPAAGPEDAGAAEAPEIVVEHGSGTAKEQGPASGEGWDVRAGAAAAPDAETAAAGSEARGEGGGPEAGPAPVEEPVPAGDTGAEAGAAGSDVAADAVPAALAAGPADIGDRPAPLAEAEETESVAEARVEIPTEEAHAGAVPTAEAPAGAEAAAPPAGASAGALHAPDGAAELEELDIELGELTNLPSGTHSLLFDDELTDADSAAVPLEAWAPLTEVESEQEPAEPETGAAAREPAALAPAAEETAKPEAAPVVAGAGISDALAAGDPAGEDEGAAADTSAGAATDDRGGAGGDAGVVAAGRQEEAGAPAGSAWGTAEADEEPVAAAAPEGEPVAAEPRSPAGEPAALDATDAAAVDEEPAGAEQPSPPDEAAGREVGEPAVTPGAPAMAAETDAPAAGAAEHPGAAAAAAPGVSAEAAGVTAGRAPAAPGARESVGGEVVTETLADLYLAQGLVDRAVGLYRQLMAARPGDARLEARLREAEARLAGAAPPDGGGSGWEVVDAAQDAPEPAEARVEDVEAVWTGGDGTDAGGVSPYAWSEDGEDEPEGVADEADLGQYLERLLAWKPGARAEPEAGPPDEAEPPAAREMQPEAAAPAPEAEAREQHPDDDDLEMFRAWLQSLKR